MATRQARTFSFRAVRIALLGSGTMLLLLGSPTQPTVRAEKPLTVSGMAPVSVSATSGTVEWRTNRQVALSVAFGTVPINGASRADTRDGTLIGQDAGGLYLYRAAIDGLTPRMRYFYRIVERASDPAQATRYHDAPFSYLGHFATLAETVDKTPRIEYWWGKVNQHVDVQTGAWETDPDGTSGADLDKLGYCKKWYPATVGVEEYRYETIFDWKAAGNTGSYPGTHLSHRCLDKKASLITR